MSISDEEFKQTVLDYFGIQAGRHRDIMNTMTELNAKADEIKAKFAAVSAKLNDMHTSQKTAVMDLGTAVAAGHATMIDSMMTTLNSFGEGLTIVSTAIDAMHTELTAAVAGVPTAPPVAAPAPAA